MKSRWISLKSHNKVSGSHSAERSRRAAAADTTPVAFSDESSRIRESGCSTAFYRNHSNANRRRAYRRDRNLNRIARNNNVRTLTADDAASERQTSRCLPEAPENFTTRDEFAHDGSSIHVTQSIS